jgi:hypothetical protein
VSAILAATISWLKGSLLPLAQGAVHVVGGLGGRVDRHAIDVLGYRHRRVLFHRQVGVALVEAVVLEHEVGLFERPVDVAELERGALVHVAAGAAVIVDTWLRRSQRLLDTRDGGKRLVLDLHLECGLVGGVFGNRGHRGHRIAHHPDLAHAEGVLVLGDRQDAEGVGHRVAGEEAEEARYPPRLGGVDGNDAGVRHGGAHQPHVAEAREAQVVGEAGDAGHLGAAVDAPEGLADEPRLARRSHGGLVARLTDRLSHRRLCSSRLRLSSRPRRRRRPR